MSAGKKGKKKKNCKTVDLMSFLADGGGTPTIPLKSTNWADDVEDEHEGGYTSRSNKEPVILPTAPRAARGSRIDEENIPTNPPFVAYVTSLPYEVDEDDLVEFFAEMKVSSVRLPKDPNKQLRGYGYVEFEDRQSLINALSMTNSTMKTRRIRIEVSNSNNDERRGGRLGRDNRRDTYDDPERTSGDWRSRPRDEPAGSEGDSYRRPYDNREREREREVTDDKPGAWRNRSEDDRGRSAFKDRGFRDDDRDKEWSRYGDRGGSRDRDGDRDRDRDRGSSFGPRRDYGDWERDGRKDGKGSSETKPAETRTRPKLQLQPRTKPIEPLNTKDEKSESTTSVTSSASVPTTNIFGAAKPVDTTAREREIEERLAKSYAESRLKEEAENEKRKEGTWGRRNGEDRDDKEKDKSRETWRSDGEKKWGDKSTTSHSQHSTTARSDQHGDSKADSRGDSKGGSKGDSKGDSKNSNSRSGPPPTKKTDNRGLDSRERKDRDKEKDELDRMPKAKDEKAPNFVVSNKYSMLPDDADPDIIED
ncbi:eukaryotic translation initiation factor 4B isoform X1 [Polistes fuscatus]|uniref:eukaryotic translation initiation factor 4B isoform X1 n=1 Tax=Polistes fuscatus TaxID=30207 RepID=UPI001CA7E2CD|nr:eukaryotic translation initiation factor 4B isoform X1 [Polistes fuscatus]